MITIGGVIGTGLFLGTASSLARAGPAGLLLGYAVVSTVCLSVMLSLGELITLLPVPGGQITLSGRFVDPALAFSMGWNYWYSGVVGLPAEISATVVLINYWDNNVNNAVWVLICLVVVCCINFLGTRAYGESEFWFSSIKVLTIIGLIILGVVIDLGGAPDHDRRGFRYWHHPGPFVQFANIQGVKGRFLAFWSTLIQATYAFLGTEVLGTMAAETKNPTKNIPRAVRGVWVRILLFYIFGVFILGLICPSDNPMLTIESGTAASSAWVIAVNVARIKALPSIINACLISSAWSAASSNLFVTSRVLFGLSTTGQAPRVFLKTNRYGTPWLSVLICSIFGFLSYMAVSSNASTVFGWFSNMTSVAGLFNWMSICLTLIRFRRGLKAQGIPLDSLPYKSRFQPFAAYWGLCWTIVIILFSDWQVFLAGRWDHTSFITNYLGIPFVLVLYIGYKFVKKTRIVLLAEMDFSTGATGRTL
ncbi:amino acid transporter [Gautieria morchelliformis]|nr:amino acid transporter [Gautieria morchelliformis]